MSEMTAMNSEKASVNATTTATAAATAATMATAAAHPFDVRTAPLEQVTLVEASAGTGKTFSIKHLVLRLIVEKNIPLDRILVMTFTVAATAELKRRIEEHLRAMKTLLLMPTANVDPLLKAQLALWEANDTNPEIRSRTTVLARVEKSLGLLDRANILTIHSFCHQILESRSFSAGAIVGGDLLANAQPLERQVAEDFFLKAIHEEVRSGRDGSLFFPDGKPVKMSQFANLLRLLASNPYPLVPRRYMNEPTSREFTLVHRFVDDAPQRLAAIKAEKNVFTYDDMILSTWGALQTGWKGIDTAEVLDFARVVREDYQAVLIDEFQDTDALQLDIVDRLFFGPKTDDTPLGARDLAASGHDPARTLKIRSLFFVGDPKQAIYRFRGADLLVYLSLKARLHADSLAALTTNFRSAEAVVATLNAFFSPSAAALADESRELGSVFLNPQLHYQPVKAHKRGAELFRWDGKTWTAAPVVQLLGSIIPNGKKAEDMRTLLIDHLMTVLEAGRQGKLWIKCSEGEAQEPPSPLPAPWNEMPVRPVQPGDIAVLARANNDLEAMRQMLAARGVRVQMERKDDICATKEATEIRYVLKAMASGGEDNAQRLALATRLFGLTMDEIDSMSEAQKSDVRSSFIEARRLWTQVGIAAAFKSLFEAHHTVARLLPTIDGEEVLTNYAHLIELLHENGRRYKTPAGLIERFEAMMIEERDDRAPRLAANQGLVRLMTVHTSKGLEFPIVFALNFGNWGAKSNPSDGMGERSTEKNPTGEITRVLRLQYPKVKGEKEDNEEHEEYARLIYVALTRAKSQLVLSWAVTKKSTNNPEEWRADVAKAPLWQMLGAKEGVPISAATMQAVMDAWVAASPAGAIEWIDVDTVPQIMQLTPLPSKATPTLTLAPVRGESIRADWRTWSFTGLSHLAVEPGSFPKYLPHALSGATSNSSRVRPARQEENSAQAGDEEGIDVTSLAPTVVDDEIRLFPRGARPGECLHEMFEKADFALHGGDTREAQAAREELAQTTIEHYLTLPAEEKEAAIRAASEMIHHVLAAPMIPGLALRDLKPQEKRPETYFLMETSKTVTIEGLKRVLRAMGPEYAVETLTGETLSGFLQGFIDLIFEYQGRYWVLDWKSNVCGATKKRDFTAAVLDEEMTKHRYRLQYLIYSVALRRLMKARLADAFRDEMIGGALYVFLRGVSPENTLESGLAGGVVRDTTYPHYLAALDDYLRGDITAETAIANITAAQGKQEH